jgi:hypothetical protein
MSNAYSLSHNDEYNSPAGKSGIKEGYLYQEKADVREAIGTQECNHCISGEGLSVSENSGKENQ